MKIGSKVSVPSTIYENKRVDGILLEIAPKAPGKKVTHFGYRVKTCEGVSFYSLEDLKPDS